MKLVFSYFVIFIKLLKKKNDSNLLSANSNTQCIDVPTDKYIL